MPPSWHPVPACTHNGHSTGGPFSFAATKNRIGRGIRCRYGRCRRAILLCSDENWNRTRSFVAAGTVATPAAFYLGLCRLRGIQSPPASATASCRRNRSPLRQRRIESDADLVAATATAGWLFFFAAMQKRIGRRTSLPLRPLQAGHSSLQQRGRCIDSQVWP